MYITIHAPEYSLEYLLSTNSLPNFLLEKGLTNLPPYETIIELGSFAKTRIIFADPASIKKVNWFKLEEDLKGLLRKLNDIKQPILICPSYSLTENYSINLDDAANIKLVIFISSNGSYSISINVSGKSLKVEKVTTAGIVLDGGLLTDPAFVLESIPK